MSTTRDRADVAHQLAARLRGYKWRDPVVLANPSDAVVTAILLAKELGAEFDITLTRKLRHPTQRERIIGAIAEDGWVLLNPEFCDSSGRPAAGVDEERRCQLAKIDRVRRSIRQIRPRASLSGRSVIVVDDTISARSNLVPTLRVAHVDNPQHLIVAAEAATRDSLAEARRWCDHAVCLKCIDGPAADGAPIYPLGRVSEEDIVRMLRECVSTTTRSREVAVTGLKVADRVQAGS